MSCLRCQVPWHLGKTCEGKCHFWARLTSVEHQEENPEQWRIKIEEERTKAILRYCKQCRYGPFVKDNGCNKVTCAKCQHKQCFVCGKDVVSYQHFKQEYESGTGKCPLFDDTEERLGHEADRAEDRTIAVLLGEAILEDNLVDEPQREQFVQLPDLDHVLPQPTRSLRALIGLCFIKVVLACAVLGLTVALLKTRPPQGSDVALFSVILCTTGLSVLGGFSFLGSLPRPTQFLWRGYMSLLVGCCYFGVMIAFSVKLGHSHTCGNVDYISNNDLIAGSAVRCGLAKADVALIALGKRISRTIF
jgi:hypothetical protein